MPTAIAEKRTTDKKLSAAAARIERTKARRAARAVIRKSRAERLSMVRKKTRLSRQKFAARHNIPYGSLQNWEDPKYGGLTKTGAPRIIKALKKEGIFCSVQWLLEGTGPEPYVSAAVLLKRMKLKSNTGQGAMADFDPAEETIIVEEELDIFRHHYQDVLETTIDGEHIAGKAFPANQAQQFAGRLVLAEIANGDIAMGTLESNGSLNGADAAFQSANFTRVAPVMFRRRPLTLAE